MNGKTILRWSMLLILLAVFAGGLIYALLPEGIPYGETCMGVRLLPESEVAGLGCYRYRDYSENLKFQNEYAAIDQESSVIYISQSIEETTQAGDLKGRLTIDVPGRELLFAPDPYWENLSEAVGIGHKFKLLVSGAGDTFMEYDVVFTTLPVISLHGQLLYKDDQGRNVLSGRFRLWEPEDGNVLTSSVHWHIRGKSAAGQEKKPWKLSLKDWDGKNTSENLLGLGSDDDWVLNAMNMEDTNIREKLFMDLWNEMAADTDYNYPMSQGEYVEVLVNGEYQGLYLLQRRLDGKYIQLEEKQVLVKGLWDGENLGYECISAEHVDDRQTEIIEDFFFRGAVHMLNLDNFVDINLFLQFFCASDNMGYKNMYYLFTDAENQKTVSLIPWDTDMAFGIEWDSATDRFHYRYDNNLTRDVKRKEMDAMEQLHPDMQVRLNARWKALRKGVLSEKHIYDRLEDYLMVLNASGAVLRDQNQWGLYFEGEDTIENLYSFVGERLQYLDALYS